jgi:hypothetical protein
MSGSVFINYRRDDSAAYAGRLYDFLSAAIGAENIFLDFDHVGTDFNATIRDTVSRATVVLVIIGPDWIFKQSSDDFVRIEIEEALRQNKYIIPVLVGGARFPSPPDLPASIAPIARRNAVSITHERFNADVRSLAQVIERVLLERPAEQASLQRGMEAEAPEDVAWRTIEDSPNADDFRDFIARFPDAQREALARERMEKLLWAKISETPTTVSVLAYVSDYPSGIHKEDARAWLASRLHGLSGDLTALEEKKSGIEREVDLIVGPPTSFRNDIFVSYSKIEPEITKSIVATLEKEGYRVWWDTNLVSGDEFSDVIRRELVGSRVVVVIWTTTSVNSKWVKAEATMADFDDKLVPVCPRDLDPRNIPLPFNVQHCGFADDHRALVKAIQKKGVYPNSRMAVHDDQLIAAPQQTGLRWWKKVFGTMQ